MNVLIFLDHIRDDKSPLQPARLYAGLFEQIMGGSVTLCYDKILAAQNVQDLIQALVDHSLSEHDARIVMSPWTDKQGIWATLQDLPVFLEYHTAIASKDDAGVFRFPKHPTIANYVAIGSLVSDLANQKIRWEQFFEAATMLGLSLQEIRDAVVEIRGSSLGQHLVEPLIITPCDDKYTVLELLKRRAEFTP